MPERLANCVRRCSKLSACGQGSGLTRNGYLLQNREVIYN